MTYFASFLDREEIPAALGSLDLMTAREFVLYLQAKKRWDEHPSVL